MIRGTGVPAVIQGPGWGPPADYLWRTLVPVLPAMRVLCYDVRNTGASPRRRQRGSQSTARLVADLARVTERARFSRFVLVGHSHGGMVAAAFAALYPDRVSALILVCPTLPGMTPRLDEGDPVVDRVAADGRVEALRRFRAGPGRCRDDRELARWMRRVLPIHFRDAATSESFARHLRRTPLPSADALHGMPDEPEAWLGARLATIAAPTLLVAGRFDLAAAPPEIARAWPGRSDTRLRVLEGSAHHPWFEEPGAFRSLVDEFLVDVAERYPLCADGVGPVS